MRVPGSCVLVTGAGAGIGRTAALHFLQEGCSVTALDVSSAGLASLRTDAAADHRLLTLTCDVSSDEQQIAAFRQHVEKWGRLDVAILNAGISESGRIFEDESPVAWQRTLDIDLRAVLLGVHLATRSMLSCRSPGVIVSVASAADAPVYSAAKGGLVHFTRSAAALVSKHRIRLVTVCPQFVDTNLVAAIPSNMRKTITRLGELLSPQVVVAAMAALIEDDSKNGVARVIMQVQRLSTSFDEACALVTTSMPAEVQADEILVRRLYAGINASDVNFTSGKYHGSSAAAAQGLPFDAGFESVGIVVRAGAQTGMIVGQAVASLTYGGFSEYAVQKAAHTFPVSHPSAEAVAMLTSGLTASVALDEVGKLCKGERVLVTAAAGGTGMFAVQLAKQAGCHVIGTCSSPSKAELLRRLGADRVVNYKTESLKEVLKAEYPRGVDVVYESVGGEMFEVAVNALANKGRIIVIGMMSQYGDGWPVAPHVGLPEKLLKKSGTISGFFLPMYAKLYKAHLAKLFGMLEAGSLKVIIDPSPFIGIESIPRAVAHLQSGRSSGKVVAQLVGTEELPPSGRLKSRL